MLTEMKAMTIQIHQRNCQQLFAITQPTLSAASVAAVPGIVELGSKTGGKPAEDAG